MSERENVIVGLILAAHIIAVTALWIWIAPQMLTGLLAFAPVVVAAATTLVHVAARAALLTRH